MDQQLRTGLKRILYPAITRVAGDKDRRVLLPVVRGPARGLRFRLDLIGRGEGAYFVGRYDRPILERARTICQLGWTVWDCGTYLGFYTAFFARLVGPAGRVVAFEPDPNNLARTREHAAINKLSNVTFVNAAIGGPLGEVDFILSENTNSHLPGYYVGASKERYAGLEQIDEVIRVRCLTLDQAYIEEELPPPNLVKLDIEGAEKDALFHAERLIREVRPLIILELHNPQSDEAAWTFAESTGYSLLRLETGQLVRNREETQGTLLCTPPVTGE